MASPELIRQAVEMFASTYPAMRKGMSDTIYSVWKIVLEDLPDDLLQEAIRQELSEIREFAPSAAHIRDRAMKMDSSSPTKSGAEGWAGFLNAMRIHGWYVLGERADKLVDPLICRIVRETYNGWQMACQREFSAADRARFIELYDIYARKAWNTENQDRRLASGKQRKQLRRTGDDERGGVVRIP
jgi:hypothetical protein